MSPVEYKVLFLSEAFLLLHTAPCVGSVALQTFHSWVSYDGVPLIIYISKKESEIFLKKPK